MTPAPSIRLLDWLLKWRKPVYQQSLPEIATLNAESLDGVLAWLFLGPKRTLPKVVDRTLPGRHGDIPVRLYYPHLEAGLPLVVFFHGGGWVVGSLATHDRLCRWIAQRSGALILSVDYRRAPWHKYPVPLHDCYDAVVWAASHPEHLGAAPDPPMVMGDSAGGNLAAAVCLIARDRAGPPIRRQLLLYPAVDGTLSYPSHQHYAHAPLLSEADIRFYRAQHMNTPADLHSAYFSPLLAENLEHLPPAFILTAEYDPLHDEAKAFAEKLTVAGGTAVYQDYPGMVHAFLMFPRFCSSTVAAVAAIAEDIQAASRVNKGVSDCL